MNGTSGSATSELLAVAHSHKAGKFIGQESGGNYEESDGYYKINLVLPNSGIRATIPLWNLKTASGQYEKARGIVPDFSIEPSIEDFLAKKDRQLLFTIELIKQNSRGIIFILFHYCPTKIKYTANTFISNN
jgi:C-terminal processing protease CtpA/Prc